MKECSRCSSTNINYVTNHEHLEFESGGVATDDGYFCSDCNSFYMENDDFKIMEYFSNDTWSTNLTKASYE